MSKYSLRFATAMLPFVCCLMITMASGCSLFVMAGKMLIGDPVVKSEFTRRTRVDLTKADKEVVVLCTVPEMMRSQHSAIDRDLVDAVLRRFRIKDIKYVPSREVDRWLSSVGGVWSSPQEIAEHFDSNYIIHIDLESVSYMEENSPNMYRGNCQGNVYVYEIREIETQRNAFLVFEHEFKSVYPQLYPVSADSTSLRTFQERYVTRISDELARLFYDSKPGDDVY